MKTQAIILLAAFFLFSCQRKGDIVARVGTETLSAEEFVEELKKAPESYLEFLQTEPGRKHFLDVLIKEKIMITAAKEAGLDKNTLFRSAVNEFERDQKKQLGDYRKNLLIEKYYQNIKSDKISVSDEEIQKFYDQNSEKYTKPLKITLSHIMLSDEDKANEVYGRLKNGESFNKLVSEFSSEAWVNTESGKLEYTQPGSLSPELEELALGLAIGQVSKPVHSDNGFYIVRKDSQLQQPPISIEDARQLIEMVLEKNKFDALMGELAAKYKVSYNINALEKHFRQVFIDKAGKKN